MLPIIPVWVHMVATALVLAAALWRGGPVERFAGIYNLASNNLCFLVGFAFDFSPRFEAAWALADAMVYLAVALRSDRGWTLAAAAVALVNLWTCGLDVLSPLTRWAFGTAQLVWFYALNVVILTGSWNGRGRRRLAA